MEKYGDIFVRSVDVWSVTFIFVNLLRRVKVDCEMGEVGLWNKTVEQDCRVRLQSKTVESKL